MFFHLRATRPRQRKVLALGHYPLHWLSHVMHAMEIIGYRHPNQSLRYRFHDLYEQWFIACTYIEQCSEMISRLSEDRIEKGTVVS